MLGFIIHDDRDNPNIRMAELAMSLMADGLRLAGAVQTGHDMPHRGCEAELTVLGASGAPVRISQPLGPGAQGCRLDSDALERVVARVARLLTRTTDLLIVNKFGKQEASGRGFRDLIGVALTEDIPVLTAVPPGYMDAFTAFAGDMAVPLGWAQAAGWCRGAHGAAA